MLSLQVLADLQAWARGVTGDHRATVDGVGGDLVCVRWSDSFGNCRFVVGRGDRREALACKVTREGRAA